MGVVGYSAAVVLAVVFVVAAVTKVRALDVVVAQLDAMGIRRPEVAARVLPVGEVAVAVVLISQPWVGAALALAALVGFTVVLIRQVQSGATSGCACFGATSTRPVSVADVVRNGVLIAIAILVIAVR